MIRRLTLWTVLTLISGLATARAEPPAWKPDSVPSQFVTHDGIRVHYKSVGTGTTALVFVHGWSCDLTFWRSQVPALEGKLRMVLIDLPGHGKSDRPQTTYSMELFAKAVDVVLRDAGVEKAVLAGHSMGTPVIRQFYRLYPKKALALIAVDGSLRMMFKPEQSEQFVGRFAGPDFKGAVGQFVDGMFTDKASPELKQSVKDKMQSASQHVAVSAMRSMADPAIWKDDPIAVAVLAIMAKSPYWNDEYQAYVRKLQPKVEFHFMDGVGHFLMLEKPEAFNAILTDFLKKHGALKP